MYANREAGFGETRNTHSNPNLEIFVPRTPSGGAANRNSVATLVTGIKPVALGSTLLQATEKSSMSSSVTVTPSSFLLLLKLSSTTAINRFRVMKLIGQRKVSVPRNVYQGLGVGRVDGV